MTTRREFVSNTSKGLLGLAAIPAVEQTPTLDRSPARDQTRALGRQATGTGLIYDSRYLDHVLPLRRGESHPERPLRLVRMMEVFAERGLDQELIPVSLMLIIAMI